MELAADLQAAVAHGSNGLLTGGISRDELMSAGAAEVYPGPGDLLAALDRSLLGKIKGLYNERLRLEHDLQAPVGLVPEHLVPARSLFQR